MNISIDTEKKTISINEEIGLEELHKLCTKLLTEEEFKEYKLAPSTVKIEYQPVYTSNPYLPNFPSIPSPIGPYPWCSSNGQKE